MRLIHANLAPVPAVPMHRAARLHAILTTVPVIVSLIHVWPLALVHGSMSGDLIIFGQNLFVTAAEVR